MYKSLLILSFFLCSITAYSQNFEGEIIYNVTYKSNQPSITDQQWSNMLGTTQDYFVKGDRYFTKMNGTLIDWQSYSAKENKYYFKLTNNNKVYWKNASENKSPDTLIAHNKNVIMILGHSCDELVYKNTNRIHKYYFSTDFPMDSKLYANHHYGNWYLYLSVAQALPLKEIYISPEFTMESEATAVTEEIIDPKVFVIPAGLFLEESRY